MTTDWDYVVPRYHDSPWARRSGGSVYSADLEWPTVGIYCPHDPHPWLLGSFQVSAAVLEERDEISWAWTPNYVTGDGYAIHLKRQSDDKHTQYLVGNELHDRQALADKLSKAISEFGVGPEAAAITEEMDQASANLRGRAVMECGICGLRRVLRDENIQTSAAALWQLGRREVALESFIKFEETLRRVRRRA